MYSILQLWVWANWKRTAHRHNAKCVAGVSPAQGFDKHVLKKTWHPPTFLNLCSKTRFSDITWASELLFQNRRFRSIRSKQGGKQWGCFPIFGHYVHIVSGGIYKGSVIFSLRFLFFQLRSLAKPDGKKKTIIQNFRHTQQTMSIWVAGRPKNTTIRNLRHTQQTRIMCVADRGCGSVTYKLHSPFSLAPENNESHEGNSRGLCLYVFTFLLYIYIYIYCQYMLIQPSLRSMLIQPFLRSMLILPSFSLMII